MLTALAQRRTITEKMDMNKQPYDFLTELLETQCQQAKADAGAFLRQGSQDRLEILATYPRPNGKKTNLSWIGKTQKPFQNALKRAETVIVREGPASNGKPQDCLIIIPLQQTGRVRGAVAFRLHSPSPQELLLSHARLETTPLLLDHHELKLTMQTRQATMDRLHWVMEVLDAVNRPTRFLGSAMALCNQLATRLDCSRVSLGVLQGTCVQVKAMSHTDTFSRRMQVVQALEAAMEECLDQDLEVIHPAGDTAMVTSRSAAVLSESHDPSAVLSLPIRADGEAVAVVTLERRPHRPFDQLAEIEVVRLLCDLCAPRLLDLHANDRWLGARMLAKTRECLGPLLGYEHTGKKIGSILLFLLVLLLLTLKGDYRINAPFTLKAQHQQVVVAPFETLFKSVLVEPGDKVHAGKTILGTLDTVELRLKLAALKAEKLGYRKQMVASMRDRETAEAHIAETQIQKVAAQMKMVENKIDQATVVAPIDGWVISEDRKQQIGAGLKSGEILFEIASIDSLRAELQVAESDIANVNEGLIGTLASVGHPDQKVPFAIDRINPIAEVMDHQNVFRVRARISEHLPWMRPGMEGEARIMAGKKNYLWITFHGLVNWLRMKLWI